MVESCVQVQKNAWRAETSLNVKSLRSPASRGDKNETGCLVERIVSSSNDAGVSTKRADDNRVPALVEVLTIHLRSIDTRGVPPG